MGELGGDLDFPQKALGAEHGGELRPEHLDGDLAMVFEVVGEVDRGHSPAAQLPLKAVAVGEGGLERHYGIQKAGIQVEGTSK